MLKFGILLLGLSLALDPCQGSNGAGGSSAGDDPDAAVGSACSAGPTDQCPTAPGSIACFGDTCGLDSLPTGLSCSSDQTCKRAVDPCPNWQQHVGGEKVDEYVCACVNGAWSCGLCTQGASLCAETDGG